MDAIVWLLIGLVGLLLSYLVIRAAVRGGVSDALKERDKKNKE